MSGGINFIRGNPGTDAFHSGMQQADQRRSNEIAAVSGGMRNIQTQAEAPSRLRQVNAGADMAESNARVATATEGDRIRQSQLGVTNAEMQSFYKSLELLNQGDVEGARYVASQYGQEIPEPIIQNRQLAWQLKNISDEAVRQYPNSPAKQQQYIQFALQGLTDGTMGQQNRQNPMYPYQVPGAPEADSVTPSRGGGTGGRPLQAQWIMETALALNYSEDEAFKIATRQRAVSDAEIYRIAVSMVNSEFSGAFGVRPEQKQQRLQEVLNELNQSLGAGGPGAGSGVPPAVPSQPQSQAPGGNAGGPAISSFNFSNRFNVTGTGQGYQPDGGLPAGLDQGLRDQAAGMRTPQTQAPGAPALPQAGGEPPLMNSPEEAMRLPPGTIFRTPDGRTLTR